MEREHAQEFSEALDRIGEGWYRQAILAGQLGVPEALGVSFVEWCDRYMPRMKMAVKQRRAAVEELTAAGLSNRQIAPVLGVSRQTVNSDVAKISHDEQPKSADSAKPAASSGQNEPPGGLSGRSEPPDPVVTPELPDGQYRCVVIDPPWPMQKIVREVRPNQQQHLDYPTLTVNEIDDMVGVVVAAQEKCHVYLWVTQKFMPVGLRLFESWGVKYQCVLTWVKNGGPTPFSWMYDTEHVLFGQRGSVPLQEKGLRLSFSARGDGHSVKPAVFYQRVIAASPGPRLAMFERGDRDGFKVWGNEVD